MSGRIGTSARAPSIYATVYGGVHAVGCHRVQHRERAKRTDDTSIQISTWRGGANYSAGLLAATQDTSGQVAPAPGGRTEIQPPGHLTHLSETVHPAVVRDTHDALSAVEALLGRRRSPKRVVGAAVRDHSRRTTLDDVDWDVECTAQRLNLETHALASSSLER